MSEKKEVRARINGWETEPEIKEALLVTLKHEYENQEGRPLKFREFWEKFTKSHPDFRGVMKKKQ